MKVNKNLCGRKLLEKADNEKWGVKKADNDRIVRGSDEIVVFVFVRVGDVFHEGYCRIVQELSTDELGIAVQ
jgi:hypothetical protein